MTSGVASVRGTTSTVERLMTWAQPGPQRAVTAASTKAPDASLVMRTYSETGCPRRAPTVRATVAISSSPFLRATQRPWSSS